MAMYALKKIKEESHGEFTNIIQWRNYTPDTLVWHLPLSKSEIEEGALFIVGKSQIAVLVNKEEFYEIYQPGHYQLTAINLRTHNRFERWKQKFSPAFKSELYFVNTKEFLNLRWATTTPVMVYNPKSTPTPLHAHGICCFRIKHDSVKFIRNIVRRDENYTNDGQIEKLCNLVSAKFANYLIKSKISAFDLAENVAEFSTEFLFALKNYFDDYGIELTHFLIENISLPQGIDKTNY